MQVLTIYIKPFLELPPGIHDRENIAQENNMLKQLCDCVALW